MLDFSGPCGAHFHMGVMPFLLSSQGYFEDLGMKQVGKYTINPAFAFVPGAAIWEKNNELLQQILLSLSLW